MRPSPKPRAQKRGHNVILDELLMKFGIQADTEKLKSFVMQVEQGAQVMTARVAQANAALHSINDTAAQGAAQAADTASEAEKPLDRLRLVALAVKGAVTYAAARVLGFIVGAIDGARDLAKEKGLLYQFSEKELAQADAYNDALKRNRLAIDAIRTKIALNLVPALTRVADGMQGWLRANKDLITHGITRLIQTGGKVAQVIFNSYRAIDRIISSTLGWRNALLLLVAVLAVVKRATIAAFIANPVTWVMAAIAGLLLLLDDLMVYLDGGESLFGDFWKPAVAWTKKAIVAFKTWYESVKPTIERLKTIFSRAFSAIWKIVSNFIAYLTAVFQLIYGLLTGDTRRVKQAWKDACQAIAGMWDGLKAYFSLWVDALRLLFDAGTTFIKTVWESVTAAIRNVFRVLGDLAGDAVEGVKTTFSRVTEAITAPFKSAFDEVKRYYDQTIGKLSGAWDSVKSGVSGGWRSTLEHIGLSDNTTAPQVASTPAMTQQSVSYRGGDMKTEINLNAANGAEAEKHVARALTTVANREQEQAFAFLQGVSHY